MNDQELPGRLNGLSVAVEIALKDIYTIRHGDTEKAIVQLVCQTVFH